MKFAVPQNSGGPAEFTDFDFRIVIHSNHGIIFEIDLG